MQQSNWEEFHHITKSNPQLNWEEFSRITKNSPPWPRLVRAVLLLGHTGEALDLGCGGGRDTRYLLTHGFQVTAVDNEAASLVALADLSGERLHLVQSTFEDFSFTSYDLINAHFALPFIHKEQFTAIFTRLKAALKPRGIFVGQFFGVHDTWNTPETTMTFFTHEQAQAQLARLEIVEFEEEDQDGTTARGDAKHWHVYHISETPKERIADLYHRVASAYGQIGPNIFAYAGQHLVERIAMTEGAQVLDIGAGRGANLFPAAEAVGPHGQVVGIDLAPGMVQETTAEIKRRDLSHVTMLPMDAEYLTFPDASFDYVLCGFAIFLFPHVEQALSEFFRVLRPGGKVGITVAQNLDVLSNWYGEHISDYHTRYSIPLHAGGGKGSNYAELPHYLTHTGLINVQVLQEQADFVYANVQEWWDSRWTHGPRYALEQMAPEILAQFKAEVFDRLTQEAQSHGIHETLRLQYILAGK